MLEKILFYLDHQGLRNLQCVNKAWNAAVQEGRFWSQQLQRLVIFFIVVNSVVKMFKTSLHYYGHYYFFLHHTASSKHDCKEGCKVPSRSNRQASQDYLCQTLQIHFGISFLTNIFFFKHS